MLIRKENSKIVHIGHIPHDLYETNGSPAACNQSGWKDAWRIVRRIGSFRKCKKCFGRT